MKPTDIYDSEKTAPGKPGAVNFIYGVPKRSRTSGLLLRRQSLYPTELLGQRNYYITLRSKMQHPGKYFILLSKYHQIR